MIVQFRLNSQRDADIITWLESIEGRNRSHMIREALREHINSEEPSMNTKSSPSITMAIDKDDSDTVNLEENLDNLLDNF